jgi:glycerol uptake facilitator-like aquaporin
MSLMVALSIGGDANPAVTFGKFISFQIDIYNLIISVISQMITSLITALYMLIFFSYNDEYLGMPTVGPASGIIGAIIYEITFSTILVYASLSVNKKMRPIICGCILSISNANGADISNGALNPARAFGSSLISGNINDLWIYLTAPIIGAMFASFLFVCMINIKKKIIN